MKYKISTEEDIRNQKNELSGQALASNKTTGHWLQKSGISTYYELTLHPEAKACVVISQGRAESAAKYSELVYDLYQNGYSVFVFDHQGQGLSTRLCDNPHIGFVASFDDFVEDFHSLTIHVLESLLKENAQEQLPRYLLCHSMGGTIGGLFVQKYPEIFSKIVLCAPMIGIRIPIPESLVYCLVKSTQKIKAMLKLPEGYFWGQGDYSAYPFEKNRLTNSKVRYQAFRTMLAKKPENQLGGIGMQWLRAAIEGMRKLRHNMSKIIVPSLVLIAEREEIVDNKMLYNYASKIPNAELVDIHNAKHEILFEQDAARSFAISRILDFFDKT